MKKIITALNCIGSLIKKKFLKSERTDIYQECKNVPVLNHLITENHEPEIEEYYKNYTSTTRWQTL
ncbi:MAG TPA: hypothetical protein VKA10_07495 [Prolixibacteraceae bacterium]|nr:hypothetical protein [Prolixibacteraceae bacterium]